uniref:MEMO1 family protein ENQ77_09765 n=1 Tax=candidate division WOR-3 bacterium TaxID=2052148 RepID=A0A7C2P0U2_UNCW3
MIRYPKHAGTFYPDTQEELERFFKEFENKKISANINFNVTGAVVPHAGYIYSGYTAYNTYRNIFDKNKYKTVVILGPSHYVYFRGIAVWPEGKWITPLGEAIIDSESAEKIIDGKIFIEAPENHLKEHSIEVQVPFIQYLSPDSKILPLLVGEMEREKIKEAGKFLAKTLISTHKILIIASSDLYHGYSYRECLETDRNTISRILEMDPEKFLEESEKGNIMACGETGIAILLYAVSEYLENPQVQLIHYTNSADVTGIKGGYVVGYAGIVMGG